MFILNWNTWVGKRFWKSYIRCIRSQKLSRSVRKFVDNCLVCDTSKGQSGPSQVQLNVIPKVAKPWHTIHIDISEKLSGKIDHKEYAFFVIVDTFTKFVLVYPIKTLTGKEAAQCLMRFTNLFGAPCRIIVDQEKSFTSTEFKLFCLCLIFSCILLPIMLVGLMDKLNVISTH